MCLKQRSILSSNEIPIDSSVLLMFAFFQKTSNSARIFSGCGYDIPDKIEDMTSGYSKMNAFANALSVGCVTELCNSPALASELVKKRCIGDEPLGSKKLIYSNSVLN